MIHHSHVVKWSMVHAVVEKKRKHNKSGGCQRILDLSFSFGICHLYNLGKVTLPYKIALRAEWNNRYSHLAQCDSETLRSDT